MILYLSLLAVFFSGLLLFRTPTYLRFVCSGNNLEGQFLLDRDSLYIQDFPMLGQKTFSSTTSSSSTSSSSSSSSSNSSSAVCSFGVQLREFLAYIPYKNLERGELRTVNRFCSDLLRNATFAGATGRLVCCMPSHRCDKGGWKHLRQALMELNAPCIRKGGRIDIATGHFGQIQPPFLANMCTLLKNNTNHEEEDDGLISKGDGWNNPLTKSKIGMAFLYFCSRSTVLAKNTNSFAVLRTTAPGTSSTTNSTRIGTHSEILDKYFYDAKPKFIPMTTTQELENKTHAEHPMLLPILHGKAMLAVSEAEDAATMFVGSQNFSAAGKPPLFNNNKS